jgi:hypothetical protein
VDIIIEGPTCSGKSTMLAAVRAELEARGSNPVEVHHGRPPELTRDRLLYEYVWSHLYRSRRARAMLADRWAWGELTYAPIYRPDTDKDGHGLLGRAGWRWVELYLLSRGAVTVLMRADYDILEQRYLARGDDHITHVGELKAVALLYDQAVKSSPTTELVVDTTNSRDLASSAETAVDVAAERAARAATIAYWPEYIGPVAPDALVVGDNTTQKRAGKRLPFEPAPASIGQHVLGGLDEHVWPRVGMVDASHIGFELHRLWEALGMPRVVTVGVSAKSAAAAAGIPGAATTHIASGPYLSYEDWETRRHARAIESAIEGRDIPSSWRV